MNPYSSQPMPIRCPLCPHLTLHSYEETGVHLSITHQLCYSAHILASTMWTGTMGYKQAGDILRDVGNMNQVLWNMKNNLTLSGSGVLINDKEPDRVKKMEKEIIGNGLMGNGKLSIKMECYTASKSCQTELYVKEEECQEAKVMSEPLLKRPCKECTQISMEVTNEEIMKIESVDIGFDVKEECLSPISTLDSVLGDDLGIVRKLSSDKDEIEHIRPLKRKIRMFESMESKSIKFVKGIRKTGQLVAKNEQNQCKQLEEVVRPVKEGKVETNRNNNDQAQTDLFSDQTVTKKATRGTKDCPKEHGEGVSSKKSGQSNVGRGKQGKL